MTSLFLAIALTLSAGSYDAKGVVKSFGPNRAFVNIAHEDIPGYMMAMTMDFEPRQKEQLKDLAVNDPVVFKFTETPEGKRLIDSIAKK